MPFRFTVKTKQWDRHSTRVSERIHDAQDDLRRVVVKAALNIKTDWAAQWSPSKHLPHIGASVSYDVTGTSGVYAAEIGPDKERKQGPLGTIIEDANGATRNRATHAGNSAGRRETPRFVNAVGDVGEKGVGG